MIDYPSLTRQAILESEKVRKHLGIKSSSPLSVYDAAQKLGSDVRFINVPSLEGVYSRGPHPVIILGSDRPIGRQSFNCAHELGHHVFGHSHGVDEIDSMHSDRNKKTPDEFLADGFAAHFLMPQYAILKALQARGIKIQSVEPADLYRVANYFEVGYKTLVNHLAYGCRLLQPTRTVELLKMEPKIIRKAFLGKSTDTELVIVDEHWTDRAVDIRVGDHVLSPCGFEAEGIGVEKVEEITNGFVFQGIKQSATTRLLNQKTGWCQYVRVMPRQYEGLAEYRHLEEQEDGN